MSTKTLPVATTAQTRKALLRMLRSRPKHLLAIIGLSVLATVGGLTAPAVLGIVINQTQTGTATFTSISTLGGLAVLAMLVAAAVNGAAEHQIARWGEFVVADLRNDVIHNALTLDPKMVAHIPAGELTARISADTQTVSRSLRDVVPVFLIASVQVVVYAVAFCCAAPLLSPALIVIALIAGPPLMWYHRRAAAGYVAMATHDAQVADATAQTAQGARMLEMFGFARRRVVCVDGQVTSMWQARMRTLWLRTVLFPTTEFAPYAANVVVLAVGGWLVMYDQLSLGALVAASVYLLRVQEPLEWVTMVLEQVQQGVASLARVVGVSLAGVAVAPTAAAPVGDQLVVQGVSYAYGPGLPEVLSGVDLRVRPGERLAIVGPSGSGKSTLGRLLVGFDAPTAGSVTFGGVPVSDLRAQELAADVLLVTQDQHVFTGTLRDNLVPAAGAVGDVELLAALQVVGAGLESFPQGLDTLLGYGGVSTDGAVAQQIALARVVLADPKVVVLDEATSWLNPQVARDAEQALAGALAGRTVVAIAHRLHTAFDADRIAVVHAGQITELGTHTELMAQGGTYAELWQTWHGH